MNKSYSSDIFTDVYDIRAYWKCVIRDAIVEFF